MSELHNTLFVVSCLAALGLGVSAGLVYCYYAHWKPTIHAYQAALRDIHRLTRREVQPEDSDVDAFGWEPMAVERLRMIARRTI